MAFFRIFIPQSAQFCFLHNNSGGCELIIPRFSSSADLSPPRLVLLSTDLDDGGDLHIEGLTERFWICG